MGLLRSLLLGVIGSLLLVRALGSGISIQLGKRSLDRTVINSLESETGDVPLLNYLDAQVITMHATLTCMHVLITSAEIVLCMDSWLVAQVRDYRADCKCQHFQTTLRANHAAACSSLLATWRSDRVSSLWEHYATRHASLFDCLWLALSL